MTFYLSGNLFGIDILAVKEINRNIEYTAVPGSPSHIIGLLNMRGQVVTLFNLSGLLGYDSGENEKKRSNCVILKNKTGNLDYVGFFIDSPGSVIDIDDDICEPPPANLSGQENKYIQQVAKLEDELLMIINQQVIYEQ